MNLKRGSVRPGIPLDLPRKDVYRDFCKEDAYSRTDYDTNMGGVTVHHYDRRYQDEVKTGDIYSLSLNSRLFTDSCITLLWSTGLSTGTFKSIRIDGYEELEYETSSRNDGTSYNCNGSYGKVSFSIKGGKSFRLPSKVTLTGGLAASYEWTEEKPVFEYHHITTRTDTTRIEGNSLHEIPSIDF